ncbi:hypothetical protein NQ176_g4517 [Zarea fungicola]|uniref:Uncharacterized protein n=1 Tax=Zarea fungicola TaxID=93591 RepID=A0ACC1NFI2_9HYPO|nr:hypothetical protein NQ176_g4517 [Lecanicillium fungicola]
MVQKQATSKRKPAARTRAAKSRPTSQKESLFVAVSSGSDIGNGSRNRTEDNGDVAQLSVAEQQRLLDNFTTALGPILEADNFAELLRDIKQALFERDFAAAFGREEYLDAYAARWSPTRALCYAGIFRRHLPRHLKPLTPAQDNGSSSTPSSHVKMVCIGGCAAEHVAFASYLQRQSVSPSSTAHSGSLTLVDSASWSSVSTKFQNTLTSPIPLSKYASETAKVANIPVLSRPEQLNLQVLQQDALLVTEAEWADIFTNVSMPAAVVVTLFFTLNELYSEGGIMQTTKFLKALEASLPDQSLLLVVDSPGSYSEAALGKDKKKYPMQWLLHHTLTDPESTAQHWSRLESHDSIWFRLPEQLEYPIPLEHMRYQLHLYRINKANKT